LDAHGAVDQDLREGREEGREGGREGGRDAGECAVPKADKGVTIIERLNPPSLPPSLPPYLVRSVQVVIEADVNVAVLQGQRMAERDELARFLGAHHAGHCSRKGGWEGGREGGRKEGLVQSRVGVWMGGREGRRDTYRSLC